MSEEDDDAFLYALGGRNLWLGLEEELLMTGSVYPRPAKKVVDTKTGKARLAPVRKGEVYLDSRGRERVATSDSTWTYYFTTGSKKAGNFKQHKKGGFKLKKDAEAALTKALGYVGHGDVSVLIKPSNEPLRIYLERWIEGRAVDLKPSTIVGYWSVVDAWIVPHIGDLSLCDVSPEIVVRLYALLRRCGGRKTKSHPGGRPLGSRSLLSVHVLLQMAFADAVPSALPANPVDLIPKRQRPKHRSRRQPGKHWDPKQAARFIAAVVEDRRFALWSLLLDSGMRRGEVCALRWTHVDLETGEVTVAANRVHAGPGLVVECTTKSDRVRTFTVDPRTVATLKAWHTTLAQEKLAAGEEWAGDLATGYVFVDEAGVPLRPDTLNYAFEKACERAKVPVLSPHGLRHTAATLALARGVPPHVVQERLGHADISITLGLYGHVIPGQQADAARAIGDAIYGTP